MDHDAQAIGGPRHARVHERRAHRWGKSQVRIEAGRKAIARGIRRSQQEWEVLIRDHHESQRYVLFWKHARQTTRPAVFLLAKPTPLNISLDSDRFAMFNKQRDISCLLIYAPLR
jgi:hypothetical protein